MVEGLSKGEKQGSSEMKICKRCFKEFNEMRRGNYSPAKDLGDIFISAVGNVDVNDLCPECKGEIGLVNLMSVKAHLT